MFTLPVRLFLVAAGSAYGIYKIANGYESGYVLLFAAPLIVFGYFRYGAIRPAFKAMERGDLDVARKHIETIRFPNLLSAQSKAYYHWINGVLAAEDPDALPHAENEMRLAISGALRTSHDRCLATATLAQIVALGDDVERAMQLLADAEQIPRRDTASVYLNGVRSKFDGRSEV
jgi:hypothetical protein